MRATASQWGKVQSVIAMLDPRFPAIGRKSLQRMANVRRSAASPSPDARHAFVPETDLPIYLVVLHRSARKQQPREVLDAHSMPAHKHAGHVREPPLYRVVGIVSHQLIDRLQVATSRALLCLTRS
jgi:hypothetical protein